MPLEIDLKVATILLGKADPPLGTSRFKLDVEEGGTVQSLISKLGIPGRLVGSVVVNGRRRTLEATLSDGDVVAIIPAISGG